MKRWWSIEEFRSTARGTGWGSVRGTRNWGADQTWTLKINGVQWNGKAGWRDSPASWDLSSTAADKIRTTLILMMCLIWACWEWWENSETYNYLYMPTVTILACVILTLFNWNYEPTVTILACVILTLFNSNYAVTVIIAILLFLLYNAEPNTEGYYPHIVGCHCSFGLVHFKQCYLCLWSIHTVYYHRKRNCWYFETRSLYNHSCQRPSVKLKMHEKKSRWGFAPYLTGGAYSASPEPLAGL